MADEEVKEDGMPAVDGDGAEGEVVAEGGGGGMMKILLIVGPVAIAVIITAVIFIFFVGKDSAESEGEIVAEEGAEVAETAKKPAQEEKEVKKEEKKEEKKEGAKHGEKKGEEGKEGKEGEVKSVPPGSELYHEMDSMVVNIFDRTTIRYLKVSMTLAYIDPAVGEKIIANNAKVKDTIIFIVGDMTLRELNDAAGREILKEDIILALNKILGEQSIANIYFTEFTIQ